MGGGPGDASQRLLMAHGYSQAGGSYLTGTFWWQVWPPGPFIILGLVYQLQDLIGLTSISYVTVSLIVSGLIFSICTYFVYLLVQKFAGAKAGLFAAVIYSGLVTFHRISSTGLAETYALPFVIFGFLYYAKYLRGESGIWASAIFLALGTLCRSEVILLFPAFFLHLLWSKQIARAFQWGMTASSYTILKTVVVSIFFPEKKQYFNAHKSDHVWMEKSFWDSWDRFLPAFKNGFIADFGYFLVFFGLLALFFLIYKRKNAFIAICFLIYTTLLLLVLFLGFVPMIDRYFFISVLLFSWIIGIGLSALIDFLVQLRLPLRIPYRGIVTITMVTLIGLLAFNLKAVALQEYRKVPQSVVEIRDWLNEHLTGEGHVFFDYLGGWDQYLHAYTDRVGLMRDSYSYSYFPPLRNLQPTSDKKIQLTMNGHVYIMEYEPKYIVLRGEKKYKHIYESAIRQYPDGNFYGTRHIRPSYVQPYLKSF
jgi:hypothetical protein